MGNLILFFCLLCIPLQSPILVEHSGKNSTNQSSFIITVEDDILLVDTGNPLDWVSYVRVYDEDGEIVQNEVGCGASQCEYSVSGLMNGEYEVQASSATGVHFSATIWIE